VNVRRPTGRCAKATRVSSQSHTDNSHSYPTQKHKVWCNNIIDHANELAKADAQADAEGFTWDVPEGVTLVDLDQKLEKWVKFHNSLLMAATIHALSLPRDIKRAKIFLLRVQVSYRPDHGGVPAKFFRVDDAFTIDIEEAKKMGPVWTASIEHVDTMRAEGEASRRGSVAAVALECKPLAMQIVPFGSLRDLSPLKIQQNWKQILIRDVENGKRFTRFEMV